MCPDTTHTEDALGEAAGLCKIDKDQVMQTRGPHMFSETQGDKKIPLAFALRLHFRSVSQAVAVQTRPMFADADVGRIRAESNRAALGDLALVGLWPNLARL